MMNANVLRYSTASGSSTFGNHQDPGDDYVDYGWTAYLWHDYQLWNVLPGGAGVLVVEEETRGTRQETGHGGRNMRSTSVLCIAYQRRYGDGHDSVYELSSGNSIFLSKMHLGIVEPSPNSIQSIR